MEWTESYLARYHLLPSFEDRRLSYEAASPMDALASWL